MPAPAADLAAALAQRLPPGLRLGHAEVGASAPDPRDGSQSATWAPRRQATFAAGRNAARMALGQDIRLPMRADRLPDWPAGWIGSITHTDVAALALAAPGVDFTSVGLDAEQSGRVAPAIYEQLFSHDEASLPGFDPDVAFAAKEALFKLLHPLTGQWFGFHAARVWMAGSVVYLTLTEGVGPFSNGWSVTGPVVRASGHVAVALWLASGVLGPADL